MRMKPWGVAAAISSLTFVAVCSSMSPSSAAIAGSSAAKGTPIQLFHLDGLSSIDDTSPGIHAAIGYINAHGGVKGHPLIVSTCYNNNDANQATTCANNAVNSHAVAVV